MNEFRIGEINKIEVKNTGRGFEVTFFEMMGGRWVALGAPERWASLSDILEEYGIEEG